MTAAVHTPFNSAASAKRPPGTKSYHLSAHSLGNSLITGRSLVAIGEKTKMRTHRRTICGDETWRDAIDSGKLRPLDSQRFGKMHDLWESSLH